MQDTTIPNGYLPDPQGRLVPKEMIKEIDLLRNDLVLELVKRARELNGILASFKTQTFADIAAFCELSADKYEVKLGGKKGNVSLMSFDGKYKIQRQIADHLVFDERLQAAKALIDECLTEWTEDSRPEIKTLIDNAFQVDKEGNISTGRVLGLRRLNISDAKWVRAMGAISDSITSAGSTPYIRVYEHDDKTDSYKMISLDCASI